jgi:hypothetical protein
MSSLGWLCVAILVAYALAVLAAQLRCRLRGRVGASLSWCFVPLILLCPLLIPAANIKLRAASAVFSGEITFKMVDYFRQCDTALRTFVLRDFYRLMIPLPAFSVVYPDHKRRLPHAANPWPQLLCLVGGALGFVIAFLMVKSLANIPQVRSSFSLNHILCVPIFVLAIESLSRALCGVDRLAGFDTKPIIQNAYASRTVSEFWQRYNYRMHDWFYRNVFRTTGGWRSPVRSVLLVFLVSGLLHELMFALATSRVTGYQFAFFTIQGPAALASGRLERLARRGGIVGKIIAHGSTILFMAVTSVLFFDGMNKIFPFVYVSRSPLP